jgi:hypothetical protein
MAMNRDAWTAVAATIAVVAVIAVGMHVLGGPRKQRMMQSDLRTLQTLGQLASQIDLAWATSARVLPANLERFPQSVKQNPLTNKPLVYRPKSNSAYELCATFATDSRTLQAANTFDPWAHPKGDYCFQLDAAQQVTPVPFSY